MLSYSCETERRKASEVDAKGVQNADDDASECNDQSDREAEAVKVTKITGGTT